MDLDNTLWDWTRMWYQCFRSELDEIVRISGLPEERLLPEIRAVHQRYGTSEYAFLIEELPSLRALHGDADLTSVYEPAIQAYRETRRRVLALYPGVMDTLKALKQCGCILAAYTESKAFYTSYRLRRLGLDGVLHVIYSPADHEIPEEIDLRDIRKYSAPEYDLSYTQHLHTPAGEVKPNSDILLTILADIKARVRDAVYVGDSLMKDVAMAQAAGVTDVYAEYGDSRASEAYALLRAVSHWPDEDVQREMTREHQPTFVLKSGFHELLSLFHFVQHGREQHGGREDPAGVVEGEH